MEVYHGTGSRSCRICCGMVFLSTHKSHFSNHSSGYLRSLPSFLPFIGLFLIIMGQIFRSVAMIHAASNFSHQIAVEKEANHELVTHGVYAFARHPSYFGFFWWGVGTQIFLANPISTVIFMFVLWRFFSNRIE